MLSADDLQYFLAVVRHGRLTAAAAHLGVDHTTVGRRITSLERAVGHRLFDRTPTGWHLTASGQRLVHPAETVATAVASAEEQLGSRSPGLTGSVRIVCPDGFGGFLLAPALGQLHDKHPNLQVELLTATPFIAHSIQEFDVAVVQHELQSPRVHCRRLTDYIVRLYATPQYLDTHLPLKTAADLEQHVTIWYVDAMLDVPQLRPVQLALPSAVHIQSTNLVAHWQAAAAGIGVAPIPHFIAARDPRLVRVLPDLEFRSSYWVASPRGRARLARVRAVEEVLDRLVLDRHVDLVGES
jgi:DNA-binding transcriptional LysR family regulator